MPDLMIFLIEGYTMASAVIVLPDVYETIMRSVSVSAVSQIANFMGLPKDTNVYFPGRSETVPMNNGMFGNCCDTANAVHFDPETRVEVTYEELAEENFTLSTAVKCQENFPIFIDETRGIVVRPVRRFVDFRIDIRYQAPNVVIAQRWLDDMRIRLSQGVGDLTFFLEYHYNIPHPLMALFRGLYDTMEKSAWPSGKEFKDWLDERFIQPTTDMTTMTGTHGQLSIYERQVDVVGHFDFINTPETPQPVSDKSGAYEVNFSYICRYDRPTHLYVEYPMVVHQCPIPKIFRPEAPLYHNYQQVDRKTTNLRGSLEHAFILAQRRGLPYIQYPDVDEWVAPDEFPEHLTFFTGLIALDCEDLKYVMDFKSLGRFSFSPHVLEFFDTVGTEAFIDGGLFNIRLYRNGERHKVPLVMEPGTLKLKTLTDLDPHYYYHIQISVNGDWLTIPNDYWQGMRRYPTVLWQLARMFFTCFGREPIEKMQLLGVGRPRTVDPKWPGEGTTDWTKDVPTFRTGIVKMSDIHCAKIQRGDTNPDETGPNGPGGGMIGRDNWGPTNVLYAGIIAERKPKT
jgi:hypothetical protein